MLKLGLLFFWALWFSIVFLTNVLSAMKAAQAMLPAATRMPRWWRSHCDDMYAQPAGRRYLRALVAGRVGIGLRRMRGLARRRLGITAVVGRAWRRYRGRVARVAAAARVLLGTVHVASGRYCESIPSIAPGAAMQA